MRHGTRYAWDERGCHCDECREAHRKRVMQQRARRASRIRAGDPAARHGTATAYQNWLCHCELCLVAMSIVNARRRARRKMATGQPLSLWEQQVAEDDADELAATASGNGQGH